MHIRLAAAVSLTFLSLAANASTATVNHDRAQFQSAFVGAYTVEDFGSVYSFPIHTGVLNSSTELVVSHGEHIHAGSIKSGVTYSTPVGSDNFFNIDTFGTNQQNIFKGGFLDGFYGGDADRVLTLTFDNPVAAFGFDSSYLTRNTHVVLYFTDGSSQAFDFKDELGFLGFTGLGAQIKTATVGAPGNDTFAFAVDNVTFGGQTSAVPEPGAGLLALTGLGLAAAVRRRRVA